MEPDRAATLWREACDLEDEGLLEKAAEKYRQAVELGNVHAMNNLANLYDDKLHIKRPDEAAALYKRAAQLGSSVAAWNLAKHYENIGNKRASVRWMQIAAELGDEDAKSAIESNQSRDTG